MWTFGKKLAVGFFLSSALVALIGVMAHRGIDTLTRTSYAVAHTHTVLEHVSGVLGEMRDTETGQRGFIITGDDGYLDPYRTGTTNVVRVIGELRVLTADSPREQQRLDEIERNVRAKLDELKRPIDARRTGGLEAAEKVVREGTGKRAMDELRLSLEKMDIEERQLLKERAEEVEAAASSGRGTIVAGTSASLVLVVLVGVYLTRSLSGQIGAAARNVQGSSAELQSAAAQQVTGARESATSMNEITTTMSELLATSRQIAESAQRVAQIAEQTVVAARTGDGTVSRASESIQGIRRQVDLIVVNMLELGKKSQQIGAVLEIVSELAEQTNILAINATIEAAGAGETGRRFAVVADEIRKLADRVAGSTKEIRTLIEDVRSAVNTTVMTTETGSKAVDAGARQFVDVASSFKQIATLVSTTTEASREIELSTKQQTTAVEQVNLAIGNVAQATRETEASSNQTLQAISQLTAVSRSLLTLVEPSRARV
ncbi:MAG: histidine kinase [Labilithrix sp.]|nr:histidine kinase [Labilithrix sp.]